MSYHTNAILRPLPRLGARSVGLLGLGALGLGAINASLGANIVAVARKFPKATDGEVVYLAVAGTPGLTPDEIKAVTANILSQIVAIARQNPSMSAADVVARATAPRKPPVLKEPTMAERVATMTKRAGPAAGAFLKTCMTDPIGTRDTNTCYAAAEKQVGTLQGDQLSFYNSCLTQKASDVPVMLQHSACFAEAQKLSGGAGPAPTPAPYTPPPDASVAPVDEGGGLMSNKWVLIGGAVAVAGLAYVLLKKPSPAHA